MDAVLTLQERIDGIVYPPTHRYRLDGLLPLGDLEKRLEVILREFPDFFSEGHLLDVGSNKGFFSLYHKGEVTAIEPNAECAGLCNDLGIKVQQCTFGTFETDKQFDRIFIGNGPHYPFIEARGWAWVEKLARLSKGKVLLEGPTDMAGKDAQRCIPLDLVDLFYREKMQEVFEPWFFFRKEVPSPLVYRSFLLFEKKDELHHASMKRYGEYLVSLYRMMSDFVRQSDTVLEICTRHDRGILGKQNVPHAEYIMVDRDRKRPGLNLDAVTDELPASDVTISTAILHHTPKEKISALIANIARNTKRTMIFTGPNVDALPEVYGDHKYHIHLPDIYGAAATVGWIPQKVRRCGLTEPLCELMIVFQRSPS